MDYDFLLFLALPNVGTFVNGAVGEGTFHMNPIALRLAYGWALGGFRSAGCAPRQSIKRISPSSLYCASSVCINETGSPGPRRRRVSSSLRVAPQYSACGVAEPCLEPTPQSRKWGRKSSPACCAVYLHFPRFIHTAAPPADRPLWLSERECSWPRMRPRRGSVGRIERSRKYI